MTNPYTYKCKNGWTVKEINESSVMSNKLIYCSNSDVCILAGDLPVIRLEKRVKLFGTILFYIFIKGEKVYLHNIRNITYKAKSGVCEWDIFPLENSQKITISVGNPKGERGLCAKISSNYNETVYFEYGDFIKFPIQPAATKPGWNIHSKNTPPLANAIPDISKEPYEISEENGEYTISVMDEKLLLNADSTKLYVNKDKKIVGETSGEAYLYLTLDKLYDTPKTAYKYVLERQKELSSSAKIDTPDMYLNTAMYSVAEEIDGHYNLSLINHANYDYNEPFLGWYNRIGHALCGWEDRLLKELEFYTKYQVKKSKKTRFIPSVAHRECVASRNSKMYGVGRINKYHQMYNMQSQFFDQMILAWRMKPSKKQEKILYNALKLHTRWQDECFDPDNDGLYESYINTWPTDSVWYNGGGSCEETCYAYRSHQATAEMAHRAGDFEEEKYHLDKVNLIKNSFFNDLWIKDFGYPAMCKEKGGYERLHKSAWLYNCFLPVNVGMCDDFQKFSALWYSKWALENRRVAGGRSVVFSNWVPSIWSVRKASNEENYHLALGFFKAGLGDEGYDIIRNHRASATVSCCNTFAHAIINGMFGYCPDYPNNSVSLSPAYPWKWKKAKISTNYFKSSYEISDKALRYSFNLSEKADVTLKLQLPLGKIISVDGADCWKTEAGFACQNVIISLSDTADGEIVINYVKENSVSLCHTVKCLPDSLLELKLENVTDIIDTQGICKKAEISGNNIKLQLANKSGTHLLFALCQKDSYKYYRVLELKMDKTKEEKEQYNREHFSLRKKNYSTVDISEHLHHDVRKIFKQRYESPFNGINHLSIGVDGYSPWTFTYWGKKVPKLSFDKGIKDGKTVYSGKKIPFAFNSLNNNISFTTLWSNYPDNVEIPINKTSEAIHFLVAGTTNPMQCEIANAKIDVIYESGKADTVELVNPENFWALCGYSGEGLAFGQEGTNDYDYALDGYCLPKTPPETINLGNNIRACVISLKTGNEKIKSIKLSTLSQEVVIGLMAVTLQNPEN
ncbi:MAG: hypothetical protein IKK24_03175 [Clostridia bacterium]|nr:hypothetical protein [Clostridia bacterium]